MQNQVEFFCHNAKEKWHFKLVKSYGAVYGDIASEKQQCKNWFVKFRSVDLSLKDEERYGHPVEVD